MNNKNKQKLSLLKTIKLISYTCHMCVAEKQENYACYSDLKMQGDEVSIVTYDSRMAGTGKQMW